MAEQSDPVDALNELIRARLLEVNTALPATIVAYSSGRASVLPTAAKRFADGDALEFPIIRNVRVCWPSFAGGSAGVKGPIRNGDRCLLVFAQQAVDGSDDRRQFDLQDAYAVMVDLGNDAPGDDNSAMALFFGAASIRISESGAISLSAPGGFTVDAPTTEVNGKLTQTGEFRQAGGANIGGIPFESHKHTGVQGGPSTSGGPTA